MFYEIKAIIYGISFKYKRCNCNTLYKLIQDMFNPPPIHRYRHRSLAQLVPLVMSSCEHSVQCAHCYTLSHGLLAVPTLYIRDTRWTSVEYIRCLICIVYELEKFAFIYVLNNCSVLDCWQTEDELIISKLYCRAPEDITNKQEKCVCYMKSSND